MAENDSTAQGDHVELGAVLEAMVRDAEPHLPQSNSLSAGTSDYDRAVNLLVRAANASDESERHEAEALWADRQQHYGQAITRQVGGAQ